jgi:RNA polymerase sigma-70 factor (ECF subfamily)
MDVNSAKQLRPAWQEELLKHGNTLFRYAISRVRDRHTAEDLVQDVLVTAVGKAADFAERSTMQTWLIGILRHKILDHYRWRRRHPEDQPVGYPGQEVEEDPWFTPLGVWRFDPNAGMDALDGDPGLSLERSQLRKALQSCVDRLPESLRRVFVLRELEELEPEAVCDVTGVSRGSLAVYIYRARQSLRACLQKTWVES